jgi:hypothetical protein
MGEVGRRLAALRRPRCCCGGCGGCGGGGCTALGFDLPARPRLWPEGHPPTGQTACPCRRRCAPAAACTSPWALTRSWRSPPPSPAASASLLVGGLTQQQQPCLPWRRRRAAASAAAAWPPCSSGALRRPVHVIQAALRLCMMQLPAPIQDQALPAPSSQSSCSHTAISPTGQPSTQPSIDRQSPHPPPAAGTFLIRDALRRYGIDADTHRAASGGRQLLSPVEEPSRAGRRKAAELIDDVYTQFRCAPARLLAAAYAARPAPPRGSCAGGGGLGGDSIAGGRGRQAAGPGIGHALGACQAGQRRRGQRRRRCRELCPCACRAASGSLGWEGGWKGAERYWAPPRAAGPSSVLQLQRLLGMWRRAARDSDCPAVPLAAAGRRWRRAGG